MQIINLEVEHIPLIHNYFNTLRSYIPFHYHCSKGDFAQSFFLDKIDDEIMFKSLISKALFVNNKMVGVIQYGILNYDLNYDGEKQYHMNVGDIRCLYVEFKYLFSMYHLLKEAMHYFELHKVEKIYAFEHAFGLSCYCNIGKLYQSEHFTKLLLRISGCKVSNTSYFLTKRLDNIADLKYDDGIYFKEDKQANGTIFLSINKYLVEVGGLEYRLVDEGRRAYLNYFYILDEHQGHHFGKEAFLAFIQLLKKQDIKAIDSDVDELNSLGLRFLEGLKFTKLGNMSAFIKEN